MAKKPRYKPIPMSYGATQFLYSIRPDVQATQRWSLGDKTGTGTVANWMGKYGIKEIPDFNQRYADYLAKKAAESEQRKTQVMGAYDAAKAKYAEMLTGLKPRYEALEKQLAEEKSIELGKETQLVGTEQTGLKRSLAGRGLEVNEADEFYRGEAGKLGAQQDIRRRGIESGFAGRALDIQGARSQDERNITASLAGLDVDAANALSVMFDSDRTFEENKDQFKRQMGLSEDQYRLAQKQFKQQRKVEKAQRKLQKRQAKKSKKSKKTKKTK